MKREFYRARPGDDFIDDLVLNEMNELGDRVTDAIRGLLERYGLNAEEKLREWSRSDGFRDSVKQITAAQLQLNGQLTEIWNELYRSAKDGEINA